MTVRSDSAVKILVPVKRVPDPATTIRVLADGSGIATDNVKWVINPFDEIAIEEALRIKEKQGEGEVILISVGQQAPIARSWCAPRPRWIRWRSHA
jgi:electron transfer flavoprotein alpha/beta subunit